MAQYSLFRPAADDSEGVKAAFAWALDMVAVNQPEQAGASADACADVTALLDDVFGVDDLWAVSALTELTREAVVAANEAEEGSDAAAKQIAKANFLIKQFAVRHAEVAKSSEVAVGSNSAVPHGILLLLEALCASARWGTTIGSVYECAPTSLAFFGASGGPSACLVAHVLERAAALPGDAKHVSEAHQLAAAKVVGRLDYALHTILSLSRPQAQPATRFDIVKLLGDVFQVLLKIAPTPDVIAEQERRLANFAADRDAKRVADLKGRMPTTSSYSETLPDSIGRWSDGWFEAQLADELLLAWYRFTEAADGNDDDEHASENCRIVESIGLHPVMESCRWRYEASETLGSVIGNSPSVVSGQPLIVERTLEIATDPTVDLTMRNNCFWVVGACLEDAGKKALRKGVGAKGNDVATRIVEAAVDLGVASLRLDTASAEHFKQLEEFDTACNVIDNLAQTVGHSKAFAHDIVARILRLASNMDDPRERVFAMLFVMYVLEGTATFLFTEDGSGPTALGKSITSVVMDRLDPATEVSPAVRFYAWRAVSELPLPFVSAHAERMIDAARVDVEQRTAVGDLAVSSVLELLGHFLERTVEHGIDEFDEDSDSDSDSDSSADTDDAGHDDDDDDDEWNDSDGNDDEDDEDGDSGSWGSGDEADDDDDDPEEIAAAQVLEIARTTGAADRLAVAILDGSLLAPAVPSFVRHRTAECFRALVGVGIAPATALRAKEPLLRILSERTPTDADERRAPPVTLIALDGTTTKARLSGVDAPMAKHTTTVENAVRALGRIVITRWTEFESDQEKEIKKTGSSAKTADASHAFVTAFVMPVMAAVHELHTRGVALPSSGIVHGTFAFWAAVLRAKGPEGTPLVVPYLPRVLASCFETAAHHVNLEHVPVADLPTEEAEHPDTDRTDQIDHLGRQQTVAVSYLQKRLAENKCGAFSCIRLLFRALPTAVVGPYVTDAIHCCIVALHEREDLDLGGATPKQELPDSMEAALRCMRYVISRHFAHLPSADLRTELAFRIATKGSKDTILAATEEMKGALESLRDWPAIERYCIRRPRPTPGGAATWEPADAASLERLVIDKMLWLSSLWHRKLRRHIDQAVDAWEHLGVNRQSRRLAKKEGFAFPDDDAESDDESGSADDEDDEEDEDGKEILGEMEEVAFDVGSFFQAMLRAMPFLQPFSYTMRLINPLDGALSQFEDDGRLIFTDCRFYNELQLGLVYGVANHFTPWLSNRHGLMTRASDVVQGIVMDVLDRCAPHLRAASLNFAQLVKARETAVRCMVADRQPVGPRVAEYAAQLAAAHDRDQQQQHHKDPARLTAGAGTSKRQKGQKKAAPTRVHPQPPRSKLPKMIPAPVVDFLVNQPNLRSLAVTGETPTSHCTKVRSAFCAVSRLRRHVRAMTLPTRGTAADHFTATAEDLHALEQTLCAELASRDVLGSALGFLARTDLALLGDNEGFGTATNVCSAIFALGGGRLAWQEDDAFPDHPLAPRPSSDDQLSFMPPAVADFPYAKAVSMMTPFLSGAHDALERPVLLHDLLEWLTDTDAPAYAALVATDDAQSRAVAINAVEAVLADIEGPLEEAYAAVLKALKDGMPRKHKKAKRT